MVDATAIVGAITGLKTAAETAKLILDLRSQTDIQTKVFELQRIILDAQSAALSARSEQSGLIDELKALKSRISEFEAWDEQRDRYQLEKLPPGVFVYSLKSGQENGEPHHKLCPTCFDQRQRSLLHVSHEGNGATDYICYSCKSKFRTGKFQPPPSTMVRDFP